MTAFLGVATCCPGVHFCTWTWFGFCRPLHSSISLLSCLHFLHLRYVAFSTVLFSLADHIHDSCDGYVASHEIAMGIIWTILCNNKQSFGICCICIEANISGEQDCYK